jgi:hypothetical protein
MYMFVWVSGVLLWRFTFCVRVICVVNLLCVVGCHLKPCRCSVSHRCYSASGQVGVLPCTQPMERNQQTQHLIIPRAASHAVFLKSSMPTLLKNEAFHHVGVQRRMPVINQCIYDEAAHWAPTAPDPQLNFMVISDDETRVCLAVNLKPVSRGGKPVTFARMAAYRDGFNGVTRMRKVVSFKESCMTLVTVTVVKSGTAGWRRGQSYHSNCSCKHFWKMRICPHILAVLAYYCKSISIEDRLKTAFIANKPKGRKPAAKRLTAAAKLAAKRIRTQESLAIVYLAAPIDPEVTESE